MARRSDIYGGEWIKATPSGNIEAGSNMPHDQDRLVLTIKGKATTHEWDDGKKQAVIAFEETDMRLGLNATNWDSIAAMTGVEDDSGWSGTVVELFVVPEPKSKTGHAIRVRKPRGPAPAKPATNSAAQFGKEAADRLIAKVTATGLTIDDLRGCLVSQGHDAKLVARPPEEWPTNLGGKVKAWLDSPVKAPAKGYMPIDESDIPFSPTHGC